MFFGYHISSVVGHIIESGWPMSLSMSDTGGSLVGFW